jgi:hypothetical protein
MAPPPNKQTGPTGKTDTTSQTPDPTPGTGAAPEPPVPERDEPVSWVYKLHKEALVSMLSGFGLDATGTVEELRRRVVKFFRDRATDAPVPPVQTSTPSVLVPLSGPGPSVPVLTQVPATSVPVSTPERSSRPVRVQDWRVAFNGRGIRSPSSNGSKNCAIPTVSTLTSCCPTYPDSYKGKPPPGSGTIVNGGVTGKGL